MRKLRYAIAATASAALAMPAMQVAGQAVESDESDDIGVPDDQVLQDSPDAKFYAEEFGVSVEEANRRLAMQPEIGEQLGRIKAEYPGLVAGAYIQHEPEFKGVVSLANGVERLPDLKLSVDDRYLSFVPGGGFSLKEMSAEADRIRSAFGKDFKDLGLSGELDQRTNTFVLRSTADTNAKAQEVSSMMSELRSFTEARVRHETDSVEPSDGHTYGGSNISTCTTAFTVSGEQTGVLTAGHCGNTQTYFGFNANGTYSIPFVNQVRNATADVQWHTSSHTEPDDFYGEGASDLRDVTGQVNWPDQDGAFVCHRGKTTGYSCGTVQTKTYQPTYSNACNGFTCDDTWVRVEGPNLECNNGDSGGAVFVNRSAYGVYKGQSSTGNTAAACNWMVYMAIDWGLAPLGVTLRS